MSRIEDSPALFGSGVGRATYGDTTCGLCGLKYNEGEDRRGCYDGDSVRYEEFAGLVICECCFARVEQEVLLRMPTILAWYARYVRRCRASVDEQERLLADALRAPFP